MPFARYALFLCLAACSSEDKPASPDLAMVAPDLSGFVTQPDLSTIVDLSMNADLTTVATCTSLDGKFTVNGALPQNLNTVNTGLAGGAIHITMSCGPPTAFSWSVASGSCGAGAGASNMGRTYDCQLAGSSSVSLMVENLTNPGVKGTRTFVAF